MNRIIATVLTALGLVVLTPGTASAGTSYVGNTCEGTDQYIRYARADGVWRSLGCGGVVGSVVVITSSYPFRAKNNKGSDVCYRANTQVAVDPYNNIEHVNAWTVRSC